MIRRHCSDCGKLIRIDKPILGSLHICIPTVLARQIQGNIVELRDPLPEEIDCGERLSVQIPGRLSQTATVVTVLTPQRRMLAVRWACK